MSLVILAEDETQLRGLIAEMLESKGLSVAGAADGAEALQLIKDNPGAA
jgi:CheY-like chemotaxis protein